MPDENPHTPVTDRREAARAKAKSVRAKQSRWRAARFVSLALVAIVALGAVGVVVTWAINTALEKQHLEPEGESGDGFVVTSAAGLSVTTQQESLSNAGDAAPAEGDSEDEGAADEDAADDESGDSEATDESTPSETPDAASVAEIRVYIDYLSPGSKEWQLANASQLSTWLEDGAVELTYYPVSMLAAKSNGTKYSLRAAGAAACVATFAEDRFFAFNNELLVRQPEADADGFSDAELADIAQAVGVSDIESVRECIMERSFDRWVMDATERAVDEIPDTDGLALTGTPTILVNGRPYVGALDDPEEFARFVLASSSDEFYKAQETPSPSPTDSPSPSPSQDSSDEDSSDE